MRGLSAQALRITAALSMVIDHVGAVFFPEAVWMTAVGRIAYPLFAFLIVEGAVHTRDWKKYALRLLLLAVISELPFDWLTLEAGIWTEEAWHIGIFSLVRQNTVFTLLAGLLVAEAAVRGDARQNPYIGFLAAVAGAGAAWLLQFDYGGAGVLLIYFFYLFRGSFWLQALSLGLLSVLAMGGLQVFALAAAVPIFLYSGRNGRAGRAAQAGMYLFYPLHLIVISMIGALL